ncbi:uncharacterized protein VTP21DRAFT_9817 [Calcarisporiella thermophila]|uniref:uncharacterized protein n=1 Tax=Calcarisporiella thermophila TaxID=911321 RepID=UPI00374410E6
MFNSLRQSPIKYKSLRPAPLFSFQRRSIKHLRGYHGETSPADYYRPRGRVIVTSKRGTEIIHDPLLNKGTAFSIEERERLQIRGLVPPRQQPMDKQLERVKNNLDHLKDPLQKAIFLLSLQDRNEALFFKLVMDNIEELAGIIYTPTVGLVCQKFHSVYRRARGMYFSTQDRGAMSSMVYNWPHDEVDVIVVTDGSRVLGLGDLGSNSMQISIGKLALYVAAGGIRPRAVLPVVIDVGTNNENLLNDPLYLGMPHRRIEGEEYYSLVDEWVEAVLTRWPNVLIQFEDFKHPHAYNLLNKYKDHTLCFNDDIQSTSAIALAGILASLRAQGRRMEDIAQERIICLGAGSAGIGVCEGIVDCMQALGGLMSRKEAYSRFWMFDQYGLLGNPNLTSSPPSNRVGPAARPGGLNELQVNYARADLGDRMSLEEVVEKVKPTIILGLSGTKDAFTERAIRTMAKYCERPVVFPLSNPTAHSECTAEEACRWTEGRALFASGSPFKSVEVNGQFMQTNQCNNSYSFPGIGLGVTIARASRVTPKMFQEAAKTIASIATESELKRGVLFPGVKYLREVATEVATRVVEVAYDEGVATARLPEARGAPLREVVRRAMWRPEYEPIIYQPDK